MAVAAEPAVAARLEAQDRLFRAFKVLIVLALFINLAKILLGGRMFILAADALLMVLFFWVASHKLVNDKPWLRIEWVVLGLLALGTLQLFNPNVPTIVAGIEGFRRLLFQMLTFLVATVAVRDRESVFQVAAIIAVCAVPILAYGIKQFFFLSSFDYALISSNTASIDTWRIFGKTRAFSIFNGPFHLGLFAGLSFWVAVALYVKDRRWYLLALAALALAACLASLTRSSLVALLGSIPVALFFAFPKSRMRIAVTTFVILLALVGVGTLLITTVPEVGLLVNSLSSLDSMTDGTRFTSRFEGYEKGLDMMARYPTGLGMGSAADAMDHHFIPAGKLHITSHNLFLRVGLETGWPGLILFLIMLGMLIAAAVRLRRAGDQAATLLLVGPFVFILIAGLTGSTIGAYPVNLLLWSLAGMLVGLSYRKEMNRIG